MSRWKRFALMLQHRRCLRRVSLNTIFLQRHSEQRNFSVTKRKSHKASFEPQKKNLRISGNLFALNRRRTMSKSFQRGLWWSPGCRPWRASPAPWPAWTSRSSDGRTTAVRSSLNYFFTTRRHNFFFFTFKAFFRFAIKFDLFYLAYLLATLL